MREETGNLKGAKSQERRAKSEEPRAKSQERRAKSQERRAKSGEPRAEGGSQRSDVRDRKLRAGIRLTSDLRLPTSVPFQVSSIRLPLFLSRIFVSVVARYRAS